MLKDGQQRLSLLIFFTEALTIPSLQKFLMLLDSSPVLNKYQTEIDKNVEVEVAEPFITPLISILHHL